MSEPRQLWVLYMRDDDGGNETLYSSKEAAERAKQQSIDLWFKYDLSGWEKFAKFLNGKKSDRPMDPREDYLRDCAIEYFIYPVIFDDDYFAKLLADEDWLK